MFSWSLTLSVTTLLLFTNSQVIPDPTTSSILLQQFDTYCGHPDLNGVYTVISCPTSSGFFPLYYRQYKDTINWIYYDSQGDALQQGWKVVANSNDLYTGHFIAWCPTSHTESFDIIDCYMHNTWIPLDVMCVYDHAYADYIVPPESPGLNIVASGFTNDNSKFNGIWEVYEYPPSFSGNFTVYTRVIDQIPYYIYYNSYHGMWILSDDLDVALADMIDISFNTIDSCSTTHSIIDCTMEGGNAVFDYYALPTVSPTPAPTTFKPTPSPTPRPTKWWDTQDPTTPGGRRRRRRS